MSLTSMKSLVVFVAFALSISNADVNLKQVRCLVCRTVVDEFKHEVNKIDPTREVEIGQYTLDQAGNAVHKKVPLSKSEVYLSELLESICKKMDDYVRATYKSNGKLTLLKLISDNGMNPLLNEVDIIQDGDLNKSLEYFCTDIINEHEESFIEVISKKEQNPKAKICSEIADYCGEFGEDLDDDDENETNEIDEENEQDINDEL